MNAIGVFAKPPGAAFKLLPSVAVNFTFTARTITHRLFVVNKSQYPCFARFSLIRANFAGDSI
ncbi:hypothetical protein SAMN02745823_01345 [Sporobacter termitidis DSM 10068]|uniref:Uncharacterized protein n=1 Tax=Sporobacter termitidis DSM 10068 TaxID=1123282 RepID=A0A1M5WLB1_9FIRM|nr:hypothetical protein SAMN02745823_01345 [Sporobacter termitidis DSM 10068]